jgi:hypothetical protein
VDEQVLERRFDDGDLSENKFQPKFKARDEICGFFFAGTCRGASAQLISNATGVYINTIRKLLSKKTRAYVGIKKEFAERGEREFGEMYYTVEIAGRLAKTKDGPKGEAETAPLKAPARRARARAG